MLFKKVIVLLSVVTCFTLCSCNGSETNQKETVVPPAATNEFHCSILKVGQADAMILRTANHTVIIDCGEEDDGDEVVEYLQDNMIESVDYLFITHFDKDHVGGVPEVIEHVDIKQIVSPDYEGSNDAYENYRKTITDKNISPILLTENMSFILDDVLFEVYPPQKKSYAEGDNDFSLAISVTHGDNSFLFTGDAESVRLSEIMEQTDREYDFLKFPHHGRYNNKTKMFIEAVNPTYAVITCSEKNPAEEETISVLENANCKVYYTKDGNVDVKSDGSEIIITQ